MGKPLQFFLGCTLLSSIDSLVIVLPKVPLLLVQSVCTLLLILLAPLTCSPFLHSVAHYSRLVIPWQVLQ
jgi:hypothetical protein